MKPGDTVEVATDCQDSRGRTFNAGQRGVVLNRRGLAVLVDFEDYDEERELNRQLMETVALGEGLDLVPWCGWIRIADLKVLESGGGTHPDAAEMPPLSGDV